MTKAAGLPLRIVFRLESQNLCARAESTQAGPLAANHVAKERALVTVEYESVGYQQNCQRIQRRDDQHDHRPMPSCGLLDIPPGRNCEKNSDNVRNYPGRKHPTPIVT